MKRNLSKPLIMGVINTTPDSFTDGGLYTSTDKVLRRVEEMIKSDVDIIDLGGESTRPGSERVSEEEEAQRVLPSIREIRKRFDIPLSIDTYKYNIAREACDLGVKYINDVSMLADDRLAKLSGSYSIPIIIMHSNGDPKTMQLNPSYSEKGVFYDVNSILIDRAMKAKDNGAHEVILDPGIGFGKTLDHNLRLIKRISELGNDRFRTLLGISRKSFIKAAVGIEDVNERDIETMAIYAYTYGKTDIIRVHNVELHTRMSKILNSLSQA